MKRNKSSFERKLTAYTALSAGLLGMSQSANAQIFSTDIHPDLSLGDTTSFIVNINGDKHHDYNLFQGFSATAHMVMIQMSDSCELLGEKAGNYLYPFALDGDYLMEKVNPYWYFNDFGTLNYHGNHSYGKWQGVSDKYLGMKLILNGKTHYGYLRLDVSADARTFVIKDMAFEFTPEKPLRTGQALNTYGIGALEVTAESENAKPSDIRIKFNKAKDESKISEYRVIFVKTTDPVHFTPDLATNLTSGNYIVFNKTGNDFNDLLPDTAKDKDGDIVKHGEEYKVYVLSVADGVHATDNILTWNGRKFSYFINSSPAGKPQVTDNGDNGNGSDLLVTFTKAADEDKVASYRIFVVKSAKAGSFTIDAAKNLGPLLFHQADKTGSDISLTLGATAKDTDGDFIQNDTPYKLFILSLADGEKSSRNILSPSSDEITLINTSSIFNRGKSEQIITYLKGRELILSHHSSSPLSIEILNLNGKVVYQNDNVQPNLHISLDYLSPSVYLLNIQIEEKLLTKKILVH